MLPRAGLGAGPAGSILEGRKPAPKAAETRSENPMTETRRNPGQGDPGPSWHGWRPAKAGNVFVLQLPGLRLTHLPAAQRLHSQSPARGLGARGQPQILSPEARP